MSDSSCLRPGACRLTACLTFLAALGVTLWSDSSPAWAEGAPAARAAGKLIASGEPLWPQWRGVRRDGCSDETGLLQSWPAGGPKGLWTAEKLGAGWSSPVAAGELIYITGDVGDELHIVAIGTDGKERWRTPNGKSWKGSFKGARATCSVSDGCLYHMNAHGRLACLDLKTGKELWAVETLERFGAPNVRWAISECVVVDGPRVIVSPGGPRTMMAALDKKTGQTVWASEPIPDGKGGFDKAGYASPLLFELGGRRYLVNCSSRRAYAVDADTGKLLWHVPRPTRWEVVAQTPTLVGDAVLVSTSDGTGSKLYRLLDDDKGCRTEIVWDSPLDNMHGCLVLAGGRIYGSGHQNQLWSCLDPAGGKTLYRKDDAAMGSIIHADGRLYCLSQEGVMMLLEPTGGGFVEAGRFDWVDPALAKKKKDVWAHPVISQGRLYLRYHDRMTCFDVRGR